MITSHVLDTARGTPASDLTVCLDFLDTGNWRSLSQASTNANGRVAAFPGLSEKAFQAGTYRLRFATGEYFRKWELPIFFPYVEIVFEIKNSVEHYHVPLLLSPFAYSTYRGS